MTINDSNYEEVIAKGMPIVLDFWATWCGPCRMISPIIEELASEYEGKVVVGKVNIEDDAEDLISAFGIHNVPTVLFIKDGEVVNKIIGAASKAKFEEAINAML